MKRHLTCTAGALLRYDRIDGLAALSPKGGQVVFVATDSAARGGFFKRSKAVRVRQAKRAVELDLKVVAYALDRRSMGHSSASSSSPNKKSKEEVRGGVSQT